jgi:DNA-binding NarL/FixJ family response regulator
MIAGELLQSYREADSGPHASAQRLTARQREVLQLFAEGRSAKEVAAVLKVSTRTAEFHKARILEALGIHSTADMVQYAIRHGFITV